MNKIRIFPTLTLLNGELVKTNEYKNPRYIGDPINSIRLFNNKDIDEICILDISERFSRKITIESSLLKEMAKEAFVPMSYGGNIRSMQDAVSIISFGFEKVVVNSLFHSNFNEINEIVDELGSQSVVLKIDYTSINGKYYFYSSGKVTNVIDFANLLQKIKKSKVGEVIFSRVDFDGSKNGFDIDFGLNFLDKLDIPIVLSHGANSEKSINDCSKHGFNCFTASAAYLYLGKLNAVLIHNPFKTYNV